MTDDAPMTGFLFEFVTADMNAPGGRRRRHLYAVAPEAEDVARVLPTGARLIDSGPDVLAKARELGVSDRQSKIVDAED